MFYDIVTTKKGRMAAFRVYTPRERGYHNLLSCALLHGCVAHLIKRLEGACGDLHSYPTAFFRHPDTLLLDVWEEATTCLIVRVRHVIAVHHTNTSQFTATSHDWDSKYDSLETRRQVYGTVRQEASTVPAIT